MWNWFMIDELSSRSVRFHLVPDAGGSMHRFGRELPPPASWLKAGHEKSTSWSWCVWGFIDVEVYCFTSSVLCTARCKEKSEFHTFWFIFPSKILPAQGHAGGEKGRRFAHRSRIVYTIAVGPWYQSKFSLHCTLLHCDVVPKRLAVWFFFRFEGGTCASRYHQWKYFFTWFYGIVRFDLTSQERQPFGSWNFRLIPRTGN